MKNKFNQIYLDLIYQWNEEQIYKQNTQIFKKLKQKELYDMYDYSYGLINQATYFDKIDQVFEDWFSSLFDEYIKELQQAILNDEQIPLYKSIKISDIANHLPKHKIKNYKNFHNFIDILKHSNGYLNITINGNSNSYIPPLKWTGEKIKIQDRKNIFFQPIDIAGQNYKSYMIQLTNKCKTLQQIYSQIKKEILSIDDFGLIEINNNFFKEERLVFKKSALTHQFGHFLDYLIKINAQNWDIGRQYRSNVIHNDFNPDNINTQERINYFLDENEFQHLASTYIEHLKIIFNKCTNDINDLNIFLQTITNAFKINDHIYYNIKTKEDQNKYTIFLQALINHFYFKDMNDFFNIIYKDSLVKRENIGTRNKWTILMKWLKHELKRK